MTTSALFSCRAAVVDWGTSNLRVWLLGQGGRVLAHAASADGADGLSAADFEASLRRILTRLGAVWPETQLLPVVVCGMAGARNGWREAGYVAVPATPDECFSRALQVTAARLDVRILPGLSRLEGQYADVMRGEETQLAGFISQEPGFTGCVGLPGTHCKWVSFEQGKIVRFQTVMTGELFSLLSKQSVLRHVIGNHTIFSPDAPAFTEAVLEGVEHAGRLSCAIFSVRAAGLLKGRQGSEAAARLSGLLIGHEMNAMFPASEQNTPIVLGAEGALAPLYARALTLIGRNFHLVDVQDLTLAGLRAASRQLFGAIFEE
ncbi:2-dehydro-3-deoxygalactonokinase [Acidocella sp.]|uniref:2-dehydro-3-deoxygalactonokinase n=1 Tax=Acidocella sp. TaxID=50710 RepID=UPI00262904FD|nr:2-dehydro-3-deoxygalactonokinase [Acidocella sp.]